MRIGLCTEFIHETRQFPLRGKELKVMCISCGEILSGQYCVAKCSCGRILVDYCSFFIQIYWPKMLKFDDAVKLQNSRRKKP